MVRGGRRQGRRAPLSFGEERAAVRQGRPAPGPAGPWPDKRLRATAGQGLNYLTPILWLCWPMLAYVGLSCGQCGPGLGLCWPSLGAMLAYLEGCVGRSWGLCWPIVTHVEPKDPKNGNSKKTLVLWLCWPLLAHLGAMLASMWAHLGAMLAHLGPILGLGWPILGLCWPILRPMLAHVTHLRPQESKNGSSKKHRKTQVFLVVGGRGGGQLRAPRPPGRI